MHFDDLAQEWDDNHEKIARAKIFAKEINDYIQPSKKLKALEFGCGTGLLSFQLKDVFKKITLVDYSVEMINVLKEKIRLGNIKNFKALNIDLLKDGSNILKHDVIYTLMTLHHIPDINKTLKIFNSKLVQNGYLCIADLVEEDGSFHSQYNGFCDHNGFDMNELSIRLLKNGFRVVYSKEFFIIEKKINNKTRKYPLFLMICIKTF